MIGRRRPDTDLDGPLPPDIQPGDYWKVMHGEFPMQVNEPSNLTHGVWFVVAPEPGFGPAMLTKHTVREEDDGTISIRPGDGSSNSVLIYGSFGKSWHGYIEHGEWQKV